MAPTQATALDRRARCARVRPDVPAGERRGRPERGLPRREHLDARPQRRRAAAGDAVAARRRLRRRHWRRSPRRRRQLVQPRRRRRRDHQQSSQRLRMVVPGRARRRGVCRVRRRRDARPGAGADVDPGQHRPLRRRSGKRDDLGHCRGRAQDVDAVGHAVGERVVPPRHRRERRTVADPSARSGHRDGGRADGRTGTEAKPGGRTAVGAVPEGEPGSRGRRGAPGYQLPSEGRLRAAGLRAGGGRPLHPDSQLRSVLPGDVSPTCRC